jgi:3-oxoacyl-[acyl-carrier protein] reductase
MTTQRERAAFITGAGRGIGRSIAQALSTAGFSVIVNDLPGSEDLNATADEIRSAGGRVTVVEGDIADLSGHAQLTEKVWQAYGSLDCLVNNAGISVKTRGDLLDVSPESFDRLIDVNLRAPFFLTQTIARRMAEEQPNSFRSIITISSINVEFASIDRAEYCISKNGLAMMNRLYATRLAEYGINTYEIRPGVIRTNMTAVAKEKYDRLFANGLAPMARWGEPEDVSKTVSALAGGAFAYSTGETIHVDGGLALRRL